MNNNNIFNDSRNIIPLPKKNFKILEDVPNCKILEVFKINTNEDRKRAKDILSLADSNFYLTPYRHTTTRSLDGDDDIVIILWDKKDI